MGLKQESPWKPLETLGCQTGNYVETTGNLGLPDRKQHRNHWKPRVARQETTWKPLETKGCQTGNYVGNQGLSDRKLRGNHWKPMVVRQETTRKPLETKGCQTGNYVETWGCQTVNYAETTGNQWLSDRKLRGNHWKPRVVRQETTWKPGVVRQETTWKPGVETGNSVETTGNLEFPGRKPHRKLCSKLDGKNRFLLLIRKPYINYLPTMAVALIVYKYCMGMMIFYEVKLDILSLYTWFWYVRQTPSFILSYETGPSL